MDGMHDMGGRQGFGPVVIKGNHEGFHETWEKRINAMTGKLVGQRIYNMDEYRHAIERMEPRHYVNASYYERVFAAVVTMCIEKGIFTREELNQAAGEEVPVSLPSAPGRVSPQPLPDLRIGDRVQVRDERVSGHVRAPGYVRGKTGRIVGMSPEYPFPDAAAHGLTCGRQRTFDVCFNTTELWPDAADEAEVVVGLFHGYLEKLG